MCCHTRLPTRRWCSSNWIVFCPNGFQINRAKSSYQLDFNLLCSFADLFAHRSLFSKFRDMELKLHDVLRNWHWAMQMYFPEGSLRWVPKVGRWMLVRQSHLSAIGKYTFDCCWRSKWLFEGHSMSFQRRIWTYLKSQFNDNMNIVIILNRILNNNIEHSQLSNGSSEYLIICSISMIFSDNTVSEGQNCVAPDD